MKTKWKGSQTYLTAALLTLSGGFLDAYTYFCRGGVFANAQTGNIVKLGISLAERNGSAMHYLIPILAFCFGTWLSMFIEHVFLRKHLRHIRRISLLAEIGILLAAGSLPSSSDGNTLSAVLVSFACAVQMETFRTFHGKAMTTTVSTGNLRKACEQLFKGNYRDALAYFAAVLTFLMGAFLGTHIAACSPEDAILVPVGLLAGAMLVITVRYHEILAEERQSGSEDI